MGKLRGLYSHRYCHLGEGVEEEEKGDEEERRLCCCFVHDISGSRLRLMYGCEREWSSMAMTEIQVLCWGRLNAEFQNVSCQITCLLDDVCKFKISQG